MATPRDLLRYAEKNRSKIKKFCDPLIHHFGVNEFIYKTVTKSGQDGLSLHDDCLEQYYNDQVYLIDPLASHPNNHQAGLISTESVKDKTNRLIIDRTILNFGIHYSFVLINKLADRIEFFVFGTTTSNPVQVMNFYTEISLIRAFAKRFKEQFKNEIAKLEEYRIDMASLKGEAFQKLPYALFPNRINREEFLKKLGVAIPKPLTPKEQEVVKYLVKGFSAPKIAEHLLISPRTVEHHLERIKDKFDCQTKSELIQKLLRLESYGYLNFDQDDFFKPR